MHPGCKSPQHPDVCDPQGQPILLLQGRVISLFLLQGKFISLFLLQVTVISLVLLQSTFISLFLLQVTVISLFLLQGTFLFLFLLSFITNGHVGAYRTEDGKIIRTTSEGEKDQEDEVLFGSQSVYMSAYQFTSLSIQLIGCATVGLPSHPSSFLSQSVFLSVWRCRYFFSFPLSLMCVHVYIWTCYVYLCKSSPSGKNCVCAHTYA